MQFEQPAGNNPIDQGKVVGQALPRIDGALKTTGTAPYAYEQHAAVADPAYGYIVGAPIAKGSIQTLDIRAACTAPGVLAVVTAQNAGALGVGEFYVARPLAGPDIDHYHQAVAIVVATTFEQARAAAGLVHVTCVVADGVYDLAAVRDLGVAPKTAPDIRQGDFDTAFAAAPVQLDATYTTPDQSHVMMEPHATLARWRGGQLTLWTSVQIIKWGRRDLAKIFNMHPEKIRLLSPYIGGGFGGKASALSDAVLAALASRAVKRPVKVALPRPLMFNNTTHRPATVQRVRLGAAADGTLTAIGHDSWSGNLRGGMAERFGWRHRQSAPTSVRDGDWLIGLGVAAAIRGDNAKPSGARVRLAPDGMVTVETDMTDIGTGSYTILGQTAAEMLGVSLDRVVVKLGDSRFPEACGSLGQSGANSATSGVYAACMKLREAISRRHGFDPAAIDFVDGEVRSGARRLTLAQIALAGELVGEDTIEFGAAREDVAHQTFGAHFCEVAVHAYTGEVRVRRMLAVCAAGRILNPLTARSQVIGAMTMGVGAALMEKLAIDHRAGFFVNHDMASYEVPVHADVPHQEVIFINEVDPSTSPMKSKGVGELGISGVAAAVANAVYNATGVRVRDYPVTLDKLIGKMPMPA